MRSVWWSLPGPASALAHALHDLQDGRSVVVGVPASGSPSPVEQVIRRWYPDRWRRADQGQFEAQDPADVLVQRFCPDVPAHATRDVACLLLSARAAGLFLTIRIDRPPIWQRWREFPIEVELLGKDRDKFGHPTFLVELGASCLSNSVPSGMTVAWHEWSGIVSREDMRAYAAVLATNSREVGHVREMKSAVATELALWDPELIELLIEAPLAELLAPRELLIDYAQQHGLTEESSGPSAHPAWISGRASEVNEVRRWHSATLAAAGNLREIHMRVWRGQIAALFPLIEELRITAARHLEGALQGPIELDGSPVDDLKHLEVGQLLFLATRPRWRSMVKEELLDGIRVLRTMRNHLAHLEVVPPATLTATAIYRLIRLHAELLEGGPS